MSGERDTIRSLKCICIDNRGEYMETFMSYYKRNGIMHERYAPKIPKHNA